MDLATLLWKASAVLIISCGSVLGTNFPPVSKQVPIPFPPQQNVPLDFVSDAIIPETPITNFQQAERLPDSFVVTELTTERSAAGDQIRNDTNLPKALIDDWSPLSGTIGPVATPRPDNSDVPAPFVAEKEKVQFAVPLPNPDNSRKPLPPSVWVFSRGITGHYAEQGWIPFDSTVPREPPPPQGEFSNQKVPGNFPVFSTPVNSDLVFQPKVLSEWIPPQVSSGNIPRSVPQNIPLVIIQNVSVPFAVQQPPTIITAPLPSEAKPAIFPPLPPLQFFPKPIAFPPPKTFIFPSPPVSEAPETKPPVEETPAPPEMTTNTPTTTLPPPPSPPPPPPPPPTYFILPPKKEIIPIFPPLFAPPTPVRPNYFPKTSTYDPQILKAFSPSQYQAPVFPPTINAWIPGPNIVTSQFAPQWYADPTKPKTLGTSLLDETSTSAVTGAQTIPPLSSDLWIIKGPSSNVPKANIPLSTPIGLMPKVKGIVPVRGKVFSPVLDQGVVPTFPGIPAAYSVYPGQINSSSFYRLSRNVLSPLPLLRLYFARPKQQQSSPFPTYNSGSPSQLDSFPLSYTYPVMSYPSISQPVQLRPTSNKENCSTPSQDMNLVPPPASFYVQPSPPVYLPLPQNSYSFLPIRPSIPDVPAVVFQPLPTVDSRPPPVLETPVSPEDEKKRNDQRSVPAEPLPNPPEGSASNNVVVAPVFPFVNPPVSFPKAVTVNDNLKNPPYFFRFGQSDNQGTFQYRSEEADTDGIVKGSYGYRGADGIMRKVDFTTDSARYRAVVPVNAPSFSSSDPVIKDSDNFFASSSQEKSTAESEP